MAITTDTTISAPATAPAVSPAAPAPPAASAPAPPSIPAPSSPQPAPDLTGLVGAGAQNPNLLSGPNSPYQQAETNVAAANQKAAEISAAPVAVPKPGPHARLFAMIQGLGTALSAAGADVGAGGRGGGSEMIDSYNAQQQEQKIQAQQAAQEKKDAEVRQQLMVGSSWKAVADSIMSLATVPQDIQERDLRLQTEKQTQQIGLADFMSAHSGATPEEMTGLGAANSSGAARLDYSKNLLSRVTGENGVAVAVLGADDPALKAAKQVVSDPNATVQDIERARSALQSAVAQKQEATKAIAEQNAEAANAPIGARADAINSAMTSRWQVMHPGQPLPDSFKMTATSTPQDFNRADKILQQSEQAESTQAQRDATAAFRKQMLVNSGMGGAAGDLTKTGAAYLASLPAADAPLVSAIGTGHVTAKRMDYIVTRNPRMLDEVSRAYPDFDAAKAGAYLGTYDDFTHGKTSIMLNSGATAIGHLYELRQLNTPESHIPHTPAWTAYQNKAVTLSTELAKFYGDATIPAIDAIKDSLTSTLPGNRDAAIRTQAQSMGDKFDSFEQQWKNAAPSSAYQAPMPGVSNKTKAERASLDPAYAARQVKENNGKANTSELPSSAGGSPTAPIVHPASTYIRQQGVSSAATLMQVPGGVPRWIEPANMAAAQKAGATQVK